MTILLLDDSSHGALRSRVNEPSEFSLDRLSVGNQRRILCKLSAEKRLSVGFLVAKVAHNCGEHHAVRDRHFFSSDKLRASLFHLFLECGKEGSPLLSNHCTVKFFLFTWHGHRLEGDFSLSSDDVAPSLNNPVNLGGLLPVGRIVVALLDADCAQASTKLLHLFALVVDDWELAHLASLFCGFAPQPSWKTHTVFGPLLSCVEKHGSQRLWPSMHRVKILNSHSLGSMSRF